MKRPDWLTLPAPKTADIERIQAMLAQGHLHSVCESAQCPNIGECFANKTCTFMILGDVCTRNCTFCAVQHGRPQQPDEQEPEMVALTAHQLNLRHVVITSVTRDDLDDGGAGHFARTIQAVTRKTPDATIEVLIPDFKGDEASLNKVIAAMPDVINHNMETVPRLYASVRPQAHYRQSLTLLQRVAQASQTQPLATTSGLMLGLGESVDEVIDVMEDLVLAGCQMLTICQYLRPSPSHHPLVQYIHPTIFDELKKVGHELGFRQVVAGPLVRSSYHAAQSFAAACL